MRYVMSSSCLCFHNIFWFDGRNKVSFKNILLLQNLFSDGSIILISLFNSPIHFVSFINFGEDLLMLNNRCVVSFKHYLRRFDRFHLLNVVDKDRVIFRALESDLWGVMLDLQILLVHDPHGYLVSWDSLGPGGLQRVFKGLELMMSHDCSSFLLAHHLHCLVMRELLALNNFFFSALRTIPKACSMSFHRVISPSHTDFTLVNNWIHVSFSAMPNLPH